jgi:hypothetical protein
MKSLQEKKYKPKVGNWFKLPIFSLLRIWAPLLGGDFY